MNHFMRKGSGVPCAVQANLPPPSSSSCGLLCLTLLVGLFPPPHPTMHCSRLPQCSAPFQAPTLTIRALHAEHFGLVIPGRCHHNGRVPGKETGDRIREARGTKGRAPQPPPTLLGSGKRRGQRDRLVQSSLYFPRLRQCPSRGRNLLSARPNKTPFLMQHRPRV